MNNLIQTIEELAGVTITLLNGEKSGVYRR